MDARRDPQNKTLFRWVARFSAPTRAMLTDFHFHSECFQPRHRTKHGRLSDKAVQERLRRLLTSGYLNLHHFSLGGRRKAGYSLGPRIKSGYPDLAKWITRAKHPTLSCLRAWVRGEIWRVALKHPALEIENARFLSTELAVENLNEIPVDTDVIWSKKDGRLSEAIVCLVDDGYSRPAELVSQIPVLVRGRRTRVVVRALDDGTHWNAVIGNWEVGRRFGALLAAVKSTERLKLVSPKILYAVGAIRQRASVED